jgi:hypothetical protein
MKFSNNAVSLDVGDLLLRTFANKQFDSDHRPELSEFLGCEGCRLSESCSVVDDAVSFCVDAAMSAAIQSVFSSEPQRSNAHLGQQVASVALVRAMQNCPVSLLNVEPNSFQG